METHFCFISFCCRAWSVSFVIESLLLRPAFLLLSLSLVTSFYSHTWPGFHAWTSWQSPWFILHHWCPENPNLSLTNSLPAPCLPPSRWSRPDENLQPGPPVHMNGTPINLMQAFPTAWPPSCLSPAYSFSYFSRPMIFKLCTKKLNRLEQKRM